jgi:hypothetical protein
MNGWVVLLPKPVRGDKQYTLVGCLACGSLVSSPIIYKLGNGAEYLKLSEDTSEKVNKIKILKKKIKRKSNLL